MLHSREQGAYPRTALVTQIFNLPWSLDILEGPTWVRGLRFY